VAAWKTKPSWVLVSANDRMLPPAMELAVVGQIRAIDSVTLPTGHMSIQEDPKRVADFIEAAARTASSL
jgi:pimeloyl-ACP methyl ester carboxylesterase